MNVIALTSFIGLALVGLAIAFFVHQTKSDSGGEEDALMPLDEEGVRIAGRLTPSLTSAAISRSIPRSKTTPPRRKSNLS